MRSSDKIITTFSRDIKNVSIIETWRTINVSLVFVPTRYDLTYDEYHTYKLFYYLFIALIFLGIVGMFFSAKIL